MFIGISKDNMFDSHAKDYYTARNLELVQSLGGASRANEKKTLYGCLDRCNTNMGKRMVRANILQPSSHLPTIIARMDCVGELLCNESVFVSLKKGI